MALLELSQQGPMLCIKATNSQQHRCCLSAAISSSPACVHLFKKLHFVTLAHLLPSLTCLFVFLFSIPNFLCSGALFHQREDGGGISSSYSEFQLSVTLPTGYRSHTSLIGVAKYIFLAAVGPVTQHRGTRWKKIIMSFGVRPQAEGYLPSTMFLTWVQMLSVQ